MAEQRETNLASFYFIVSEQEFQIHDMYAVDFLVGCAGTEPATT
jgi:hypothetical protein